MKAKFTIWAILATCTVLSSCVREQLGGDLGKEIKFTARAQSAHMTKTNYSGKTTTVGLQEVERIDWEDDDVIRILSDNAATSSNSHYADYSITLTENKDRYSYASAAPYGTDHGLLWGEGTNSFFSVFPVPGKDYDFTISGGNGLFECTLPANQSYTTLRDGANESYYGDMDHLAFMTAATTTTSEGNNITLSFTPIVTTFYVTVTNATGKLMKLQKVSLSSAANTLTATWRTSFTTANVRTYSFMEGSNWVETPTRTNSNSTIYAEFNELSINNGDDITVALFAIPKDITQLTLSVTTVETGEISLPLKYEENWLSFTGGNKYNLNNLGLPPVSYSLTVNENLLKYDYTGVATSDQEFTVTSTKTIGTSTKPAPWKTQIKNSSDEWVDLDGNCPDWLDDFPLNSEGITTNDKTYKENVDPQPVTSHIDRLKANKVYTSSGDEYDNSTQENAIDLSKYNFITRRQEAQQTTANTYIIASPGWYKIPMVYGNLFENNNIIADACKGSAWNLGHLDYFKKSTDANIWLGINYPWLQSSFLHHAGIIWEKYTVWNGTDASASTTYGKGSSAGIPVSSSMGVINNLHLGEDNKYMYFYVDPTNIRPGNALLATFNNNNTCCWSWQIWITDQKMNTIQVGNNDVLPVNIGWIDDTEGQYYAPRSAVLKFVSTEVENLETDEMTVTQPEFERVSTSGWQTYYQWGRKDPMAENVIFTYDDDGAMNRSIKYPNDIMYDASTKGVEDDGTNKYYDWTSANYNNLWDSQFNDWKKPSDVLPNHKTVYDPSPRGFSVAPDAAWDDLVKYGYTSFENGIFFRTTSGGSETIFFPASGYIQYDSGTLANAKTGGYYWTIRPGDNTQRRASYSLRFYKPDGGALSIVPKEWDIKSPFETAAYRAYAYSVRPVLYIGGTGSGTIEDVTTTDIIFEEYEHAWEWDIKNAGIGTGYHRFEDTENAPIIKEVGDVKISIRTTNNTYSHTFDPAYYFDNHYLLLENHDELKVSVPSGHQIIFITLILASNDGVEILGIPSYATITAESSPENTGHFTDGRGRKGESATWEIHSYTNGVIDPSANEVTFTTDDTGGNRKITGISVTYK